MGAKEIAVPAGIFSDIHLPLSSSKKRWQIFLEPVRGI
jgi:hypothetical protein